MTMKNIFNFKKTITRPNIGETTIVVDDENEKPTLWNKKNIFPIILIGFLIIIVLSNLSLIPLDGYKKNIEKQLKLAGFNARIKGGASLNLFSLRYELKDVEIYSKEDNINEAKCHSSVQIVTPMIYVSFLTANVTILDSHFIISTNNNGAELYDFIKEKISPKNMSFSIDNAQINLELCDISGYAGSSQGDSNTDKLNVKTVLQKETKTESNDNNAAFYSSNLLTIKQMDFYLSDNKQEFNGSIVINKVLLNARFKNTDKTIKAGLHSDYINFDISSDKSKPDSKGIIGNYTLNSDDFGKFISIIRGDNNDFIASIVNKMPIKINGDISIKDNIISSFGNIVTSYGNGDIKTEIESSKPTKININFDELKTDHYSPIISQKEGYNFLAISDFLFQGIMRFDHIFDLEITKIIGESLSLSDISFGYNIIKGDFISTKLNAKIGDNDGSFSLIPNDVLQKINAVKIKINLDGKNLNNLIYLAQNTILSNNDTLNIDNETNKKISYSGYTEITFGLDGDIGISDFMIKIDDTKNIKGSYMIMQPKDNNDYLFSSYQIAMTINGWNIDNVLNSFGKQKIWKYITKIRNIKNDIPLSDVGFLKQMINYTNYNPPSNISINLNNAIINNQEIIANINFKNQNNLVDFNCDIKKNNLFTGFASFSVDARQVVPVLHFKLAFDTLDIKAFDTFLYNIYDVPSSDNISIFDYLKRGFYLPNMTNINSDINVEVKSITGNVFNIKNFSAYIKGIGNAFIIDKISGDMLSGSFVFSGDFKNKNISDSTLNFRLSDLELSYLMESFLNKPNIATGKISFDGNFTASGNSIYDILFSSRGTMTTTIQNMYWPYLDFATLSNRLITSPKHGSLDINKILDSGKKMFFQNTGGDIILENGIMTTNGIAAKAPGVSSVLKISIDLLNNELRNFDGTFLVLGKDPRAGKDYLSIPIAFKAAGKFNNLTSQLYVDRVQEYIKTMHNMEVAKGVE
jgi:hypothetical protein